MNRRTTVLTFFACCILLALPAGAAPVVDGGLGVDIEILERDAPDQNDTSRTDGEVVIDIWSLSVNDPSNNTDDRFAPGNGTDLLETGQNDTNRSNGTTSRIDEEIRIPPENMTDGNETAERNGTTAGDQRNGNDGVNTDTSEDRVRALWGGTPPWEGTQDNEDACFTHFHRDDFDETHCGWALDVPRPPENGDNATEDRTLTEAPAPEALGMEWISYPNPRDVMPDPYTAQDQPSIKVCTVLLNQDNEPIVGNTVPDTTVNIPFEGVPYLEAQPATFDLPLTQYADMLGSRSDMPEGDGWLDAECLEFANLEPGAYRYHAPNVTGANADEVAFVGVTEYWDTSNQGDPFNQRVHDFGTSNLSDGEVTLDTSHDGRHAELVYLFRRR